jgi:hypothetical protein
MALAEATSGEFLIQNLADSGKDLVPVVRRFSSKFSRPAHGAITSTALAEEASLAAMRESLDRRGRASIEVQVKLYDGSETQVLTAEVEWFLAVADPAG